MGLNPYDQAVEDLAQTPMPQPSVYDEIAGERAQSHEVGLRRSLRLADQTSPDKAAEARRLSLKYGVPAPAIARNLDEWAQRDAGNYPVSDIRAQSPKLAGWLQDENNAAVASDDLDKLGFLEWLTTAPQRAFARGVNQLRYGQLRSESLFRPLTREEQDLLSAYKFQMDQGGALGAGDSWFKGAITGGAEQLPNLFGAGLAGLKYGAVGALEGVTAGALAGSVLPGVGTVAGALAGAGYGFRAGGIYGAWKLTAQLESGWAYDEYQAMKDEYGQPLDPDVAKAAALATGAINGGVELVGLEALLTTIPGLKELGTLGVRSAVKEALRVPTIRAALGEAVKSYAGTLAVETATEVAQRAVTILSGELAKATGHIGQVPGQLERGNVNLFQQPKVVNPDGTISTVDSVGVNVEGKELLLPTVTPDGRHLATPEEAIAEYTKTGRHLGVFESPAASTAFAEQLHQDHAAGKYDQPTKYRTGRSIAEDLVQEAAGALQGFALTVLPGTLMQTAIDVQRARRASQATGFYTALGEGVAQSKTAQRMPEAVQALIAEATKDGPIETVYAPLETWNTYWQSKGVDPAEMAAEVTGNRDVYEQATQHGGDLAIPTARYATKLAATEHNGFFKDELRLGPDEMNGREAAAFTKQQAEQAAQAPAVPAAPTDAERIHAELVTRLTEGGRLDRSAAETVASVFAGAFPNVAERAGVDLQPLIAKWLPEVQSVDEQAVPPAPAVSATFLAHGPSGPLYNVVGGPEDRSTVSAAKLQELGIPVPETPAATGQQLSGEELRKQAMETRAAARLDKTPPVADSGGVDARQPEASGALSAAGRPARNRIAPSRPRIRESPAQRTVREAAHVEGVFTQLLDSAQTVDASIDPADLRAEFDYRLQAWKDLQQSYADSGHDPKDLLRAIAANGGLNEASASGWRGELADLKSGSKFGAVAGIGKVFRGETTKDDAGRPISGLPFDVMHQRLLEDARFAWIENVNMLFDALDEIIRNPPDLATLPGTDELRADVRIDEGTAWWKDQWRPLTPEQEQAILDAEQAQEGDTSFNVDEFNQGAAQQVFSSYKEAADAAKPGQTVRSITVSGGPKRFVLVAAPAAKVDLLSTGEAQPRLPGAETVREQEIATPQLDAPFSLTSEVAKPKKGQQGGLEFGQPPVSSAHDVWQQQVDQLRTELAAAHPDWSATRLELEAARAVGPEPQDFNIDEFDQTNRGAIAFRPGQPPLLRLFEGRDLSTIFHEVGGHLFLELMGDVTDQIGQLDPTTWTSSQQQLQTDYANVLTWLGVENRGQIGTEQHEQFARGFEAYLFEGKAPSLSLRRTFARVRAWLLSIYKSASSLNVTLTPEVRAVFDRLLVSDQAIADAEARRGVPALFTTAADAGMTEQEFAAYRQAIENASRVAREQLDQQLLGEVRREQTATWKAQRAELETAVTAEIEAQPVYRALAAIQRGTHPNGEPLVESMETPPLKLSKDILVDRHGKDRLKQLPRPYVYTRDGGMDPNTVAELFGFSSGDELLTAIERAPSMKSEIARETDRRMLDQHGSLLLDGTLPAAAQTAISDEERDAIIRAELRALNGLRRTVDPFVRAERQAGRTALQQELAERDYERRWLEAEAKLRIAIAEGHKQVEIDQLQAEVSTLKAQARGGAATIRAAIPPADTLRTLAQDRLATTRIRSIRPQEFWSASRRAAQQTIDKAARQDFDGAIVAKQQELINLALYREAERSVEAVQDGQAYAQNLTKKATRARIGLAGGSWLDQMDSVLDQYSFAPISQKALDRLTSRRKWVEGQESQGIPVGLSEQLLDDTRKRNYQELTLEEFTGVIDGLRAIVHAARLKNRLLKAADEREFAGVRDSLVDSIGGLFKTRPKQFGIRPSDQPGRTAARWFLEHRRLGSLIQSLDAHVDGGPMWSAIMMPINQASVDKQVRNTASGKAYAAILEAHSPGRELRHLNDQRFIPAVGMSLSQEERIMVAMNWGNQEGRDRLLNDPHRRMTRDGIDAILDTLEKKDWDFVQATLDHVNSFWPEIAALEKNVHGVAPENVAALPIQTKYGEYPGGYMHLAYDSRFATSGADTAAFDTAKAKAAAAYVRQTTKQGHTEARRQFVKLPLRLELGVVLEHLDAVIHDLTHREMLIDVTRLIRSRELKGAIIETQGDIFYKQITSALEAIAVGERPSGDNVGDRAATYLRKGTQIALLGGNLWTGLQQPLGLFNGADRVGADWVAKGLRRWLKDASQMENTLIWISEVDPAMRDRIATATKDLADLKAEYSTRGGWFDNLVRTVSGDRLTQQSILDTYLWHIGMGQRVADVPTWLGMYMKAQAAGETEERAIALARQAVLDSQGGGQIKDLSKLERGGPTARLMMTFYSYGGTVYNATARRIEKMDGTSPLSIAQFLGGLSLLYILPALATTALSRATGRSGDDDDDWTDWIKDIGADSISQALNGMIYVRETAAAVKLAMGLDTGVRGYGGPAGLRPVELFYRLAEQIRQGELDTGLWHAGIDVAGVALKFPSAQFRRTIDGWVAWQEGKAGPAAVLVGPPPKPKAQ